MYLEFSSQKRTFYEQKSTLQDYTFFFKLVGKYPSLFCTSHHWLLSFSFGMTIVLILWVTVSNRTNCSRCWLNIKVETFVSFLSFFFF